ncbi:MAG: hypothetical protein UU48_C0001G0054 [Candidatus Uhrbacteria bacterium GW2011_GWF2_41_16]|uniref:DUF4145 domain-containing protein n=2 Tax=Candidatus Uhriibacteriota TaxID=1752732 RepID=A0A0G0VCV6_9BACT|nr:MAG: hypothetical protein UU31_C0002G0135 [Candidatus Uhrbacteria bacterium GW2011_GWA2_41_10]KKR87760.1 MAG: hypothetical protein UU35_C0001G0041 [Candidatus Uhrbacteria bacterium GW2011_GWC2_41_11]KKR98699.1 MAG: hypothetical protein UU48_C0001G0054 [Candidatus Uhrbacteria bacterium GW2011_GWF2_41_16]
MTLQCDRCGEKHSYKISQKDLDSGLTLNFACLNIKRLPRVSSFRIDFTKNAPSTKREEEERVSTLYGPNDVVAKTNRKNEINQPKLWLIYDFDQYFEEIINSYIIGSFYPVATSCTALAERLVNLFIIKMRDLHTQSLLDVQLKKYVHSRNQNWQSFELNMKVLQVWNLLNTNQKGWFKDLLDIRNRAVHFQSAFDPQPDSLKAVQILHKIIDSYFSPFERKDVLRVFEIPGEIWVKEEKLNDPFVKAFILPCCRDFASQGTLNNKNIYHENDAVIGPFSEADFIEQRKNYQANLTYEPIYQKGTIEGKEFTFRII